MVIFYDFFFFFDFFFLNKTSFFKTSFIIKSSFIVAMAARQQQKHINSRSLIKYKNSFFTLSYVYRASKNVVLFRPYLSFTTTVSLLGLSL